uniref:PAP-associated domain-containing protein n=1 Tax=Globisporangium ultimum (strain ATCC 200006 / CBS 805.95 / DAOM BR144) TaxID=431595 RepID=K3WZD1_GLOUD
DIDLVICLPKVRRDAPADAAGVLEGRNAIKETWQQNLARKLRQEPWVVPDSVKTIPHAAIPIITLITAAPYNVRLDISFEGPGHNGLETNDVVLSLIHEFPPLAPIMLVLKSFAIERGFAISYSGGLSSYSLLLMVARYLQEHSDTVTNGFENVSAAVQHSISSQSCADFGMMLMGFLDFYGNRFDPRTTGISVASRCFLNRENMFLSASARDHHQYAADDAVLDDRNAHLHSGHWQMPQQSPVNQHSGNLLSSPGSRRYGNRSSMDWPQATHMADVTHDPHKFDPVFIEDPLRPSNNVGRNLFRIMQIRRAFSAAYSTLMAASVSPSVFNENRTTKITGVALHPDNMLRAILGVNAPVKAKSDATNSSAASVGNGAGHGLSPTNANHLGYPAAVGSGGVGFPYLNYSHTGVAASSGQYFGGDANNGAQPYPFYSHYQHQHQQQHYLQAQQQRAYVVASGNHGIRTDGSSYRRHSESVTERMTTRSEMAASEKYQKNDRRKDRLVSPRLVQNLHATAAQRSMDDTDEDQVKTRKGPARSLSFADVVVGGNTYSASTMEYHRKEPPSSPLALVRPSRFWRDDSTIEDSISEKWESKDDSELK